MERYLYSKFPKLLHKIEPKAWYYKIPDTAGTGGRRPFDAITIIRGVPWAIEFKSKGGIVTELQTYHLTGFRNAGGMSIVIFTGEAIQNLIKYMISKSIFEKERKYEKQ